MLKKIIFMISIFFISNLLLAQTPIPPTTGDGSASNPYQIASLGNLYWIAVNSSEWNKHYIQTADIDALETRYWSGGWLPIGDANPNYFTGTYDGQNYKIDNLRIRRVFSSNGYGVGLFGYINNAKISNLTIEDADIVGYLYTGGIVGQAINSTIEDVNISGNISCNSSYLGGVVGYLNNSIIHRANVSITISVLIDCNYVGGVAGYVTNQSYIQTVKVIGSIEANSSFVGGLVGYLVSGTVSNSFSNANIKGITFMGGAVGCLGDDLSLIGGNLYRSFSTGNVNGTGGDVGGLVGVYKYGNIVDCFWDTQTSGQSTSAGGTGKTTAEMKTKSTYKNWNFYTLWRINEGVDYPTFQDLSGYTMPKDVNPSDLSGDGTQSNPYIITNASELNAMHKALDKHYKLANDIDMSSTVIWDNGKGWHSIGNYYDKFTGSFDGNNKKIINLTINRPEEYCTSLFGFTSDGSGIKKVTIENINNYGYLYVGGLTGRAYLTSIDSINVSGEITALNSYAGGVVGYLDSSKITFSYSNTNIDCRGKYVGGITGYNTGNTNIEKSYSKGNIQGDSYVGGLVGNNISGSIINCYSRASVSAASIVGGAVGNTGHISSTGNMKNVYSTGYVNSPGPSVGGLIGNLTNATIMDCFWDTQTSGQTSSAGGTGKTTAEMKTQSTFTNWDFNNTWKISAGINDGYPHLRFQPLLNLQLKIFLQGAYR